MRIKVTKEKCSGCRLCQQICTIEHFEEINPKKAALAIEPHFPEPGYFFPKVCVQCGKCMEACPVGAITRQENGAYVIDPETCTDCGMCVKACPFGVVFTHPSAATPIICNFCMKCIEVCNTGAIVAIDK